MKPLDEFDEDLWSYILQFPEMWFWNVEFLSQGVFAEYVPIFHWLCFMGGVMHLGNFVESTFGLFLYGLNNDDEWVATRNDFIIPHFWRE